MKTREEFGRNTRTMPGSRLKHPEWSVQPPIHKRAQSIVPKGMQALDSSSSDSDDESVDPFKNLDLNSPMTMVLVDVRGVVTQVQVRPTIEALAVSC